MNCPNCKSSSFVEKDVYVYPGLKTSQINHQVENTENWSETRVMICQSCGVWYSEPEKK